MLDQIQVFSGIFSDAEFEKANSISLNPNWGFQESSEEFPNRKFLMMSLDDNKFFTDTLFKNIKKHIGKNYKLDRVYLNGQYFGMPGAPHIDGDEPNQYTFLVYMNSDWNILWGGATVFLDRYVDLETKAVVVGGNDNKSFFPSTNTGLLFPSNIFHFAESPSKECNEFRITLAYKLVKTS
jgi:hypothetical protein